MRDWQETNLGQYIDFRNGKTSPERADSMPFPVYGSNGVIGKADTSNANENSIVIGRVGSFCGSLYYSKSKAWVTDNAIIAEAKKGNDPLYFFYLMKSLNLNHLKAGSGQPLINQSILSSIRTNIAPQPEQKAIAAVLGALDDKIELNRRMNVTLEAMARALFKSWFVDFDPVRAKMEGKQPFGMDAATAALFPSRLVPSPLGDIPEGWSIVPVIDSAEFINGAAYKNMHFSNAPDALPVIKIAELKNGISPGTQYTNSDLGQKFRLDTGDILFSWSGSPDTSIDTFIYTGGPAWLNQHIFKVVSENNEKRCFIYWLLKYLNPTFIEIARDKQTTGLGHVTRADMQRLKFAEPSEDIVKAFYQKAGALMDAIQSNLSQAEHLAKIRDYLLPKLISGDIRIPDAEKFVEAA